MLAVSPAAFTKTTNYGTGADMEKLTKIDNILAKPQAFVKKTITVKGEVKAVCKKRGCWMELAAAKSDDVLKIKVKDGEIVFPMSTKGKVAYATGVLTGKELNLEQTRAYYQHVAEEQKHEFDPASVKQGMTLYQLATVGVTIAD